MNDRLIVSIVSILALILTIREKGKLHVIISTIFVLSIYITWAEIPLLKTISLFTYMFAVALAFVYPYFHPHLLKFEKSGTYIISGFVFLNMLHSLLFLPYYKEVQLIMFVPAAVYFYYLIKTKFKLKPESGFLAILFIFCLIRSVKTGYELLMRLF